MPKLSNRARFREDFESETGGYQWHPWRWFFGIVGIIVLIYGTTVVLGFATTPIKIGQKVTDPDNVFFQYEKFHDLCGGIVAKDEQYVTAKAAADAYDKRTARKPDPVGEIAKESGRLHQVADGITIARQQDAQQYNADSRKWTQNHFKSKGLPYRIDNGVTPNCDNTTT